MRLTPFVLLLAACVPPPADVAPTTPVRTTNATPLAGAPAVIDTRVLVKVTTNALALDAMWVYFGDEATRALYRTPKLGGTPAEIAEPSPTAMALGPESVVWIAEPGDTVLRAPRTGGPVAVVRAHGDFTALTTVDDDVILGESTPPGGAITRVSGSKTTQLAALADVPRALATDGIDVWAQTPRSIVRVSQHVATLFHAPGLSRFAMDADDVYTTQADGVSRDLVRVPKSGAKPIVLARGVRDAPIAVQDGWAYYLEEHDQPTLRRVAKTGGATELVANDESLRHVRAMAIDASGIYVASTQLKGDRIVEMPIVVLPP